MSGFVYIIGAGCGAYDLMTVRGINALKKCDAVIYDALIDPALPGYADEKAELICVGKRSGKHSASQEEINSLIVEKALEGRTVARLKGGDPFVFGRGGEEIAQLQKQGIAFEVVPGISSSVAVPGLAGIPVTHRNVSRAFHVITAHTAEGSRNFARYAALEGTLVFLMGYAALREIAEGLIRGGRRNFTPAAVISEGGTAKQRTVRAALADIGDAAEKAGLTAPAVIVVGEAAAFDFSCGISKGALDGISVTVTGSGRFTGKTSLLLEENGARVQRYPHVQTVRKGIIPALDGYDCIAFTSSYGAEMFIDHCRENHIDLRSLAGVKIAAVGSGTAETLSTCGLIPDIIPESFYVKDLAEKLASEGVGRVLILRAALGSDELGEILESKGVAYDDVKIYDTVSRGLPPIHFDTDYVVFGSSFGVRSFFENGSGISENTAVVCIGSKTADTASKYTGGRIVTAGQQTAQGILDSIINDRSN